MPPDRWGIRLLLMILVQLDEVPKGHRKLHVLDGIERVEAERVLETRHDQRKAERVETPGSSSFRPSVNRANFLFCSIATC